MVSDNLYKATQRDLKLPSWVRLNHVQDSTIVTVDVGKDKNYAFQIGGDVNAAQVRSLKQLQNLDLKTKIAFVGHKIYLRHTDLWSNKANGGFVDFLESFVSKFAILGPKVVVTGNVLIDGYVKINGRTILDGRKENIEVPSKTLGPADIVRISKILRGDENSY